MGPIEKLKQEHEEIERELLELEEIINQEQINYPNLLHVFKNLYKIWNLHEMREEKIFLVFEKEKIKIPVNKMLFEHKALQSHKQKILDAINSGNNEDLKKCLHTDAIIIITKLREHIKFEDELLYTIADDEFTSEEFLEMEKYI